MISNRHYDKTTNVNIVIANLNWYKAIALTMYIKGKDDNHLVPDLERQRIMRLFCATTGRKNINSGFWGCLQLHTPPESTTVNHKDRSKPFLFNKTEGYEWYLTEEGKRYVEENLRAELEYFSGEVNDGNDNVVENFDENLDEGAYKIEKPALNQILYGPPGTGKTYNTVVEAMRILREDLYNEYCAIIDSDKKKQFYNECLKIEFNNLKIKEKDDNGQIAFVTFHQSYSYEEFVEGVKPDIKEWNSDEEQELSYKGCDGIFKDICNRALKPIVLDECELGLNKNPKIWKVSLNGTGENEIRKDCMDNNRVRIGFDSYGKDISEDTVFTKEEGGGRSVPAFIEKMEIGDIVLSCFSEWTIDAIGVITSEYQWDDNATEYKRYREVKWLKKWPEGKEYNIKELNNGTKLTSTTIYQLKNMKLEDVLDIMKEGKGAYKANDLPYILIIDEINRGNISKIFGELITLIEPDKRIGNEHAMTVTLPYSQKPFGVPNNLYIIGTMNTSDRSIANIDIALRRRFKFVEKMPDETLVPEAITEDGTTIKLREIFTKLNNKITLLLDRDHRIGHSYFMNIETISDLMDVWYNSVIPLLNEYFYDEWDKLKLILGKNFIYDVNPKGLFSDDEINKNCIETKCEFAELSKESFIEAIHALEGDK